MLSISTDSILTHKAWEETELSKMVEGGIPYPMLSDQNGNIGKLYDVYDSQTGKTRRATFIIDPQGLVQAAEVLNAAVGRNADEILRLLQAYQHFQATKEGTPCGWHPGEKTVKPSLDIAGEVWKEWKP